MLHGMRLHPATREFARQLRRNQTDAERRLWHYLRGRRLLNLRFRRQHPIGPYYADFACLELGLVVELDGGQHNEPRGLYRDGVRSDVLAGYGYAVIRFWDNDVLRDTSAVLEVIARCAEALTQPSPAKRERE
jgi:very-short-patch-repair endonuclease